MIRRTQAAGGHATVLARGDPIAGALLLVLAERGVVTGLLERAPALDGSMSWVAVGPRDLTDAGAVTDYLGRRRATDPDLWAVELDAIDARGLVEQVTGG